jgi:hypothetical protein
MHSQTVFKVVDNVLAEGVTVVYLIALRILKANEENLLQATTGVYSLYLQQAKELKPCPRDPLLTALRHNCLPSRSQATSL